MKMWAGCQHGGGVQADIATVKVGDAAAGLAHQHHQRGNIETIDVGFQLDVLDAVDQAMVGIEIDVAPSTRGAHQQDAKLTSPLDSHCHASILPYSTLTVR